jgi:hypothetical protein
MAKNRITSIELTPQARELIEALRGRDSVRNIVSAGVVVFSKLSAADQGKAIAMANGSTTENLQIQSLPNQQELDNLWLQVEKIAKKVGVNIKR